MKALTLSFLLLTNIVFGSEGGVLSVGLNLSQLKVYSPQKINSLETLEGLYIPKEEIIGYWFGNLIKGSKELSGIITRYNGRIPINQIDAIISDKNVWTPIFKSGDSGGSGGGG